MTSINLVADGQVVSNGGLGGVSRAGEGSGGALNLNTRTLSGAGTISADGGSRNSVNNTGGGGGRIAIRYLDLTTMNLPGITAAGGDGYYADGADGTVYLLHQDASSGDLVINGQGPGSPYTDLVLPAGETFGSVILQNGARVIAQGAIVVSDTLRLTGNSVLTHPSEDEAGLRITASRVLIETGSAIDVTGRGYRGGESYDEAGHTLGKIAGSGRHSGGSHGGRGADDSAVPEQPGPIYGNPKRPDRLGAGGGAENNIDGGHGGGYVRIIASAEVAVHGAIRADGAQASASRAGMGAGGSLWISTSRLVGSGSISADGGNRNGANNTGGGDGGGRIFIQAGTIDNDGAIRADGGQAPISRAGMGSGGTVNITTGSLGTVEADGGTRGGANNVGGGGGRIAIRYSSSMTLPEANVQAIGGDGYYADGEDGTTHMEGVAP